MPRFHPQSRRFFILAGVVVLAVAAVGIFQMTTPKSPTEYSLGEAGQVGERRTYQLVVRIDKPKPDESEGFERGDIILIAPEAKKWSVAEREGFLIVKARLTEEQTRVLLRPLREAPGWWDRIFSRRTEPVTLKNRRYTVDLATLGIGPDEETGRVIEGTVFEETVVREKK